MDIIISIFGSQNWFNWIISSRKELKALFRIQGIHKILWSLWSIVNETFLREVVKTKSQISVLTQKVEQFNVKICDVGGPEVTTSRNYLKDMLDLNTELIGYLNAIGDNVNVRDLSDFLTICFCEYDSFFKDHREQITANSEQRRILLPLASDIVFNEIRRILDFITNNTVNYSM